MGTPTLKQINKVKIEYIVPSSTQILSSDKMIDFKNGSIMLPMIISLQ
jgi:hypothetical protein